MIHLSGSPGKPFQHPSNGAGLEKDRTGLATTMPGVTLAGFCFLPPPPALLFQPSAGSARPALVSFSVFPERFPSIGDGKTATQFEHAGYGSMQLLLDLIYRGKFHLK